MTLNKQRLLDEIEWVEKQDRIADERGWSDWFQEDWVVDPESHAYFVAGGQEPVEEGLLADGCGTAYCLAGHVTHADHPEWSLAQVHRGAARYAQGALGLTQDEACALFDGGNTAKRMRDIAEEIIAAHEVES